MVSALHPPVRTAFAVASPRQRLGFQLHQALGGEPDHLAQEGRIRAFRQQLAKRSLVVGPRVRVAGRKPTLARSTAVTASYTTIRDTTSSYHKDSLRDFVQINRV